MSLPLVRCLHQAPNSLLRLDGFPWQIGPLPFSESYRISIFGKPPEKAALKPQHISAVSQHAPTIGNPLPSGMWLACQRWKTSLLLFVKALSKPEINTDTDGDLRTKGYLSSLIDVIKINNILSSISWSMARCLSCVMYSRLPHWKKKNTWLMQGVYFVICSGWKIFFYFLPGPFLLL